MLQHSSLSSHHNILMENAAKCGAALIILQTGTEKTHFMDIYTTVSDELNFMKSFGELQNEKYNVYSLKTN